MARRRSFVQSMVQMQLAAEKQRLAQMRVQQQLQNQMAKQAEIAQKAYERAQKDQAKEQARLYTEARLADVNWKNEQLEQKTMQFTSLLASALATSSYIDLNSLKQRPAITPFNPGPLAIASIPPAIQSYLPPEPTGLQKMLPGTKEKYAQMTAQAHQKYNADLALYHSYEYNRQQQLAIARSEYEKQCNEAIQKTENRNREIDKFQQDLLKGTQQAINDYFTMVLEASNYPEDFPQNFKLAYLPESRQLAIEYDFPPFDIVPLVVSYKYMKTKDTITETARSAPQRKEIYNSVISQVTLRTISETFRADRHNHIETIAFNGHVSTVDKGTGHTIRPCLITVRTNKDTFSHLNLKQVDPITCLKNLNAGVSKNPEELAPIRPVLEFNMIDPRFIEEADVLSSLDQRPNLMDLSPSEFESLITNLFAKMGLETRQTQASRDGGVDCVAFDSRPVVGGKIVIQAKRYKDTVGVSAVRDLYGTVMNEGASKGILVTTSGFGKAAFEFADGKPLELLSGSNLLALLADHAGIEAKIIIPED